MYVIKMSKNHSYFYGLPIRLFLVSLFYCYYKSNNNISIIIAKLDFRKPCEFYVKNCSFMYLEAYRISAKFGHLIAYCKSSWASLPTNFFSSSVKFIQEGIEGGLTAGADIF